MELFDKEGNDKRSFEIDPQTAELVKSELLNTEYMVETDYLIYRLNIKGQRFYVKVDDEGEYPIVPSVTSIIHRQAPTSKYLINWMISKGQEESEAYARQQAHYGTWMHIVFSNILMAQPFSLAEKDLDKSLSEFCEEKEIDPAELDIERCKRDIKKDVLGFVRFCQDYDVFPVAIEHPVWGEGYAGVLDLAAWLTIHDDGKPDTIKLRAERQKAIDKLIGSKDITLDGDKAYQSLFCFGTVDEAVELTSAAKLAIQKLKFPRRKLFGIDYKSNRKDFYSDWGTQLYSYWKAFNQQHPETKLQGVMSYGCTDFRLPLSSRVTPYRKKIWQGAEFRQCARQWNHWFTIHQHDPAARPKTEHEIKAIEVSLDTDITTAFEEVSVYDRFTQEIDRQRLEHAMEVISQAIKNGDEQAKSFLELNKDNDDVLIAYARAMQEGK